MLGSTQLSVIHYKFRSMVEMRAVPFHGVEISVGELKSLISQRENLNTASFELLVFDSRMSRQYEDVSETIPRNSSVVLQRAPKESGEKLPKLRLYQNGAGGQEDGRSGETQCIPEEKFAQMTEEERLHHVKQESFEKWRVPIGQKRRYPRPVMGGPPPSHYLCHRCHKPGHWIRECTMLNLPRATGIPSKELIPTTKDDPHAMLNIHGRYVKPRMHHFAREEGKKRPRECLPGLDDDAEMKRP